MVLEREVGTNLFDAIVTNEIPAMYNEVNNNIRSTSSLRFCNLIIRFCFPRVYLFTISYCTFLGAIVRIYLGKVDVN